MGTEKQDTSISVRSVTLGEAEDADSPTPTLILFLLESFLKASVTPGRISRYH